MTARSATARKETVMKRIVTVLVLALVAGVAFAGELPENWETAKFGLADLDAAVKTAGGLLDSAEKSATTASNNMGTLTEVKKAIFDVIDAGVAAASTDAKWLWAKSNADSLKALAAKRKATADAVLLLFTKLKTNDPAAIVTKLKELP